MGLAVLVADLFIGDNRKALLGWISVAGLAASALLLLPLLDGDRSTFCLTGSTDVCSYTADRFTLVIQFLVLGGALLAALLSVTALKDADRGLPEGEYWFLLLSSAAGAALLPASRDLATLIVALEVASLPAFALVGIRHGDRQSSEAALKFFLSSVTATAVSLMGISFVYASTGTLLPHRDRRPDPARRPAAAHPRPGGRRPHPRRLRLQDGRRALPLLGTRHLRGRAPADRRLSVGRRQGRRLLRPDPRHRRRLPVVRRRLGPGPGRPGRAHHDRRQRRRPAPAGHARVQRGTPARLVLRRPGRLPPRADRRRRVLRRRPEVDRLHRRVRPHVRRREPRRLRGGRPGRPYEAR